LTDKQTGELIETYTIITTEANEVLEPVQDRMPVILKAEDYDLWLDEKEKNTERLQNLLVPYPSNEMRSHEVSKAVNSPTYDSPKLIINSAQQAQNLFRRQLFFRNQEEKIKNKTFFRGVCLTRSICNVKR
jgi:putative SOS response-associated peptidase YedK